MPDDQSPSSPTAPLPTNPLATPAVQLSSPVTDTSLQPLSSGVEVHLNNHPDLPAASPGETYHPDGAVIAATVIAQISSPVSETPPVSPQPTDSVATETASAPASMGSQSMPAMSSAAQPAAALPAQPPVTAVEENYPWSTPKPPPVPEQLPPAASSITPAVKPTKKSFFDSWLSIAVAVVVLTGIIVLIGFIILKLAQRKAPSGKPIPTPASYAAPVARTT